MATTKEITIFIAEDHLISRMGLKMLLEQTSHFKVVGEAEDGEDAVSQVKNLKPEVIMMDLDLPKLDGVRATKAIKEALPETRILIFTSAEDDDSIFGALKAGADGYCLKNISAELLANAIHSVMEGAAWLDPAIAQTVIKAQTGGGAKAESKQAAPVESLTESKIHLLSMVQKGMDFNDISKELGIQDQLVKNLLKELMDQLQGETTVTPAPAKESKSKNSFSFDPGDMIGEHYEITKCIGYGGMGVVFEAKHTFIDRKVAIKVLHEHLASKVTILQRFKTEAKASFELSHPNLIDIHDFGVIDKRIPYIVMEILDGISLSDLLDDQGALPPKVATKIGIQVCSALQEIHNNNIVHRDMKPSNIMLIDKDDDPYYVKLVDLGIAKILEGSDMDLTGTGEAIGTPPYMSPEQCNAMEVDARSDLYSFGCVLYEMYTGRRTVDGGTPMEVIMQHLKEKPPMEVFEHLDVPQGIVDLLNHLLKKVPDNRPSSAKNVKKVLEENLVLMN